MEEKKHEKNHLSLYGKIKVGNTTLQDATLNIENLEFRKWYHMDNSIDYTNKSILYTAIAKKDYARIRDFSRHYYEHNGLYRKACDYLSTLYRYDWYIAPEVIDDTYGTDKIKKEFFTMLAYLDSSDVKLNCEKWAKSVIIDGVFYGYKIETDDGIVVQELDPGYCRSYYTVHNSPVVEFNMRYFDAKFPDPVKRLKILNLFPKEFKTGYTYYAEGQRANDWADDFGYWYPLSVDSTLMFQLSEDKIPWLLNAIPAIIDYEVAKDIDRRRQLQQLAKIIVQKVPTDKNGDLIFDMEETADIHNNAVAMLKNVVGADVFTTFADVDDIDLSDTSEVSDRSLENARNSVYDNMGLSNNLFNSDGNLSLDKSAKIDASSIHQLILQFQIFYNKIVLERTTKPKKYRFRFYMLETNQFNYMDLAKYYKEQMNIGNSKLLSYICLGNSQSSILHLANMENNILELQFLFTPPLQSSSTSSDDLDNLKKIRQGNTDNTGRPALADDQKSDKTIQNIVSAS